MGLSCGPLDSAVQVQHGLCEEGVDAVYALRKPSINNFEVVVQVQTVAPDFNPEVLNSRVESNTVYVNATFEP